MKRNETTVAPLLLAFLGALSACGHSNDSAQSPPPPPPDLAPASTGMNSGGNSAPMSAPNSSAGTADAEEVTLVIESIPPVAQLPSEGDGGPVQPTPGADRQAIVQKAQRRLHSHHREMRVCYDNGFLRDSKLAGTVSLKFTLMPTGDVTQPTDHGSTIKDPEVLRCISNVIVRTKFDPFQGKAISLVEPLSFSPPTFVPH